jgi:hypothetical protein
MPLTLREAIDKTLMRVALAQGVDVQTYAEDPIKQIIQHKFDILFDAEWWPQFYNSGEIFVLDGATGVVTADLVGDYNLMRFMDIRHVWYHDEARPLPRAPVRLNPSLIKRRSIVATNVTNKIFKIIPTDSTGNVTVAFRAKPPNFENEDDEIDMDEHLIVMGSAYDYLNGLGTNPEEEAKLKAFFDQRYKVLTDAIESGELALGHYDANYISDEWQEVDSW